MSLLQTIGFGLLVLCAIIFITYVLYLLITFHKPMTPKKMIQFLPLVILTSICTIIYYGPDKTEELILYIALAFYFIFILIIWFLRRMVRNWKKRRDFRRYG